MSDLTVARRYQDAHLRIMEQTAAAVAALWRSLGPIDDRQLEQWLARAVPIVTAAQTQAAGLGIAYIAAATRTPPTDPIDVPVLVTGLRNGTTLDTVYERPVVTARRALAEGRSLADALDIGAERLDGTVRADVQLAGRASTHEAMRRTPGVTGYRRVTDGKACRLCLLASTQRYTLEHLMPIHNRCGCSVLPIYGTVDRSGVIDKELLTKLKAEGASDEMYFSKSIFRLNRQSRAATERAASARDELLTEADPARRRRLEQRARDWDRKAEQYRADAAQKRVERTEFRKQRERPPAEQYRDEVAVHVHGELGPVLGVRGQQFTGEHDLAA